MKLSKNISRNEMACQCGCGFDTADIKLIQMLQAACDHFAALYSTRVMIKITGPNRCKAHNKSVGGAINSQHIYGRAADHKIYAYTVKGWVQIPPLEVHEFYGKHYPQCGRGIYSNRNHVDSRTNGPAVWDARK